MIEILKLFLQISVMASVMIGVVLIVRRVFSNKMSPAVMLVLWGVVLLRLILPFTLTAPVSFADLLPEKAGAVTTAEEITPVEEQAEGQTPGYKQANMTAADTQADASVDTQAAVRETTGVPGTAAGESAAVSSGSRSAEIPIWDMLVAVWIAGFAATLGLHIRKAVQFNRKLRFCGTVTDLDVLEIIARHKSRTGVKKYVTVLECDFVNAPAVFRCFKPCILIPSRYVAVMDRDSLNAILLHEIYHIRCRDIFKNYIWLAAKALHWFNPLVWLAYRWFSDDIEVRRDEMAACMLNMDDAFVYSRSLIEAARFSKQAAPVPSLATTLFESKCKLKRRVLRLVGPHKKMKSAAVISALLALVMTVACFTTACQPTPEKPIVQSKDNDSVAQAIESSADASGEIHTFSAPDTWQSEAHDDAKSIDLYVDAAVDVPTDTWGIYELMPSEMKESDLQTLLDAIVGDATIYGEQTVRSKEYLLEQITRLESQRAEFERLLDEGGLSEDEQLAQEAAGVQPLPESEEGGPESVSKLTDEELEKNIANYTQTINEAKAALPTAPDEDTVVRNEFVPEDMFREDITEEQAQQSGFTYHNEGSMTSMSLSGTVDLNRITPADISISMSRGDYNSFNLNFTDYDDDEQGFFDGEPYTGQELQGCTIGMEEAAQIARDKVSAMGFGYLDIDKTYACQMLDRQRKQGDQFPECFEFVFTRSMDGATATSARGDGVCTEEKDLALQYAPYWGADEVTVHVDDSGVIGIKIGALKSDVTRQAYGIELKDFEEVMGIFETQLAIENAFMYDAYPESAICREVHIDEIRLGYMPTAWKDHAGQLIFTPVWDFFGYEVVTYEEGTGAGGDFADALDENNKRTYDLGDQSLLTINALDGTIMIRQ